MASTENIETEVSTTNQNQMENQELIDFEIKIQHDLAMQLVGSSAGKTGMICPHRSMTKEATPADIIIITELMEPFLQREIDRVQKGISPAEKGFNVKLITENAKVLKRFCHLFAAHQRKHLEKHPGNDRLHRTRQRMDQAYDVIRQINGWLGLPEEDAELLQVRLTTIMDQLQSLNSNIQEFLRNRELLSQFTGNDTFSSRSDCQLLYQVNSALKNLYSQNQ